MLQNAQDGTARLQPALSTSPKKIKGSLFFLRSFPEIFWKEHSNPRQARLYIGWTLSHVIRTGTDHCYREWWKNYGKCKHRLSGTRFRTVKHRLKTTFRLGIHENPCSNGGWNTSVTEIRLKGVLRFLIYLFAPTEPGGTVRSPYISIKLNGHDEKTMERAGYLLRSMMVFYNRLKRIVVSPNLEAVSAY